MTTQNKTKLNPKRFTGPHKTIEDCIVDVDHNGHYMPLVERNKLELSSANLSKLVGGC